MPPDSPARTLSIGAKALTFDDPRSADLLEHVDRIARSEAARLVIGQTGTGKELIAHMWPLKANAKAPILPVNCGGFSDSPVDASNATYFSPTRRRRRCFKAAWQSACH